jgi:hypothetical protein
MTRKAATRKINDQGSKTKESGIQKTVALDDTDQDGQDKKEDNGDTNSNGADKGNDSKNDSTSNAARKKASSGNAVDGSKERTRKEERSGLGALDKAANTLH